MRKQFNLLVILLSGILLFSCEYDDSYLKGEIDKIKTDLSELKDQTNAIQKLVDALNDGKVIAKVEQLADGNGYKINFNNGEPIEIKNGSDAPVVGVKEEDGVYYWTITTNGEVGFLTDANGAKIKVSGKDADAPVMAIDIEGYWTVNNQRIKDANGDFVKAKGDSFFTSIDDNDDSVTFVMADGSTIVFPKAKDTFIIFKNPNNDPYFVFEIGKRKDLKFDFANVTDLRVISKPQGWSADIHIPNKIVNILATDAVSFGIGEIIIQGVDSKGMVFQAIAKVGVVGQIFNDPYGVYILNEGNMTTENGSLIFITSTGDLINNVYYNANGTELGNASQDLFINNDKIYIISQNGNNNSAATGKVNDGMLVIADAKSLKRIKAYNEEISILSWPSHIAVLNDENVFIRDNKGVHVLNTTTDEIKLINGSKGADKNDMAVADGKVFAISGRKILMLEANNESVAKEVDLGSKITGLLRSKDDNLWVSTTGPNKISKVDSKTLEVIKTNDVTVGGLGTGMGSTPGITAKGDTLYYNNGGMTIYRHIFSSGESKEMVKVNSMVSDAGMAYNNVAVHPLTGDVYLNTIKGYGWDFTFNNISVFKDLGDEFVLKENYKNNTRLPAGIVFNGNFQ